MKDANLQYIWTSVQIGQLGPRPELWLTIRNGRAYMFPGEGNVHFPVTHNTLHSRLLFDLGLIFNVS